MASQKDIKSRISSVKNIQKITRAMEMVSAARLRRAEQRIAALRPYARGIRMMTRRAVAAAENIPGMAVLEGREIIFNHYESPLVQTVRNNILLPIQAIEEVLAMEEDEEDEGKQRALWIYEPDPEFILQRLVTDFVEISVYRALLESTASEHGARMTAMRNASQNAGDIIKDLTLEFNRERQAAITQEIMEVVAGAESLV